ncbi:MAG: protocatechuate 3,4-dioxygenase subunit alpha [Saprospiraceae bacterium]
MFQTPSQTVGPYFAYGLTSEQYGYDFKSLLDNKLLSNKDDPDTVCITGQVFDGNGNLIPDALIELWQYDGSNWTVGRFGTGTEKDNSFKFYTIKPISIEEEAPYINIIVFMRGQLIHSYTRIYFEDEEQANASDPVLNSIAIDRRHTLLARKNESGYEFNIHMQGGHETVFFDI